MKILTPDLVPPQHGPMADLYFSRQKGEISEDTYFTLNAAWVSENVHQYPFRNYIPMNGEVKTYVDGRTMGRTRFYESSANLLGGWIQRMFRDKEENDATLSLLLWSQRKVSEAHLDGPTQKLQLAIDRFERAIFPFDLFDQALRVQQMDGRDRPKSA